MSLSADIIDRQFLASRAPADVQGAFATVWQVHASVVALSIPLLILLVEQARSKTTVATSVGNALMSECHVVVVTAFSLGSVIYIGLVALYVPDDSVLLIAFATSAATISLIAFGYWRALRLLLSTVELRRASLDVAKRRLASSMTEAFVVRWMNVQTIERLATWNAAPMGIPTRSAYEITSIEARSDGIVSDIDLAQLVGRLQEYLAPKSATTDDADSGPATGIAESSRPEPDASEPAARIISVGALVAVGDPLFTINYELSAEQRDSLGQLFHIEVAR